MKGRFAFPETHATIWQGMKNLRLRDGITDASVFVSKARALTNEPEAQAFASYFPDPMLFITRAMFIETVERHMIPVGIFLTTYDKEIVLRIFREGYLPAAAVYLSKCWLAPAALKEELMVAVQLCLEFDALSNYVVGNHERAAKLGHTDSMRIYSVTLPFDNEWRYIWWARWVVRKRAEPDRWWNVVDELWRCPPKLYYTVGQIIHQIKAAFPGPSIHSTVVALMDVYASIRKKIHWWVLIARFRFGHYLCADVRKLVARYLIANPDKIEKL